MTENEVEQARFSGECLGRIREVYDKELGSLYAAPEVRALFYWVAEEILGKPKPDIAGHPASVPDTEQATRFAEVLHRLKCGEPVQYIFGKAFFAGLELEVNPSVLIPRNETEELFLRAAELLRITFLSESSPLAESESDLKILDLCTGSGAIALALSSEFPSASVYACDISQNALQTAIRNNVRCRTRVHFFRQDILREKLPAEIAAQGPFHLIVSNPPYVLPEEKTQMHRNVLDYEPSSALFVEPEDPLRFYRSVAGIACEHLRTSGLVLAEINEAFPRENRAIFERFGFREVEVYPDLHGKWRIVKGRQ